jgi:hypothetical protein
MAESYQVKQGDCIASIADEKGFFPGTIWDHPNNLELKNRRKNENALMPGDTVYIPDKRLKELSEPTNSVYKYRLKNTPAQLRLQLTEDDKPKANLPFVLIVDGQQVSKPGERTDSRGFVTAAIPPKAKSATLELVDGENTIEYELKLGHLNPASEISGVKHRLSNLGFYEGPLDENFDEEFKESLRDYQEHFGLTVSGELDQKTRDQLKQKHVRI